MIASTKLKSRIEQTGKELMIIHFSARWSGSAFLMQNVLVDLIPNYPEQVGLLEIDIETEQELVQSLSIGEIPTLWVFNTHNDTLEAIYTGILSKQRLKQELNSILSRIRTISK